MNSKEHLSLLIESVHGKETMSLTSYVDDPTLLFTNAGMNQVCYLYTVATITTVVILH